jgi:hypothetical protein
MRNVVRFCRVLPSGVGRQEFAKIAKDLGFVQDRVWEKNPERPDYEEVWVSEDSKRAVNLVADARSEETFLCFRGANLDTTMSDFAARLNYLQPEGATRCMRYIRPF